jgi:hypothetical protein
VIALGIVSRAAWRVLSWPFISVLWMLGRLRKPYSVPATILVVVFGLYLIVVLIQDLGRLLLAGFSRMAVNPAPGLALLLFLACLVLTIAVLLQSRVRRG